MIAISPTNSTGIGSALRPRLEGLTDDEYFWEPVRLLDGSSRRGHDFEFPAPEPAPFTTIAWRMAHVIVGVLAMRALALRRSAADYQSWSYATDAATALRQLDDAYEGWMTGVRTPRR